MRKLIGITHEEYSSKNHEGNSSGKIMRKTHQEKTKKIREREKKEYAI